ncbi:MAG: NUDIX hydrolase [Patescibacteria group bacterium]|nr:NUDIX hydrolase [Patescibacteria group bacterium]MDE2015774.1 NUDIX hydrolase [Patescibacteria group bacterium]MDE2226831.1 NUDIX hydrolase [Patescibacteria group bacterium]
MLKDQLAKIGNTSICPSAIIVKGNNILLGLRNYTKEKWKDISVWTTPGGRCDAGETIEETLRREVKEEIGVTDFRIEDFIGEIPGAKEGYVVPIFFCTTEREPKLMEPEKFSGWKWFTIEQYLSGEPPNTINPVGRKLVSEFLRKRR